MDIRTALARIKTVEEGLSITTPETLSIKRVYTYFPKQDAAMPDVPCFMHTFTLTDERRFNGQRTQFYVVRSQLWIGNADQDRAADIAAAFLDKWVTAFADDVTLAGACSTQTVRGADPTLAVLERAGLSSVGLDLFMDLVLGPEAVTVGP